MTIKTHNMVSVGKNHTPYDTEQLRELLSAVASFEYREESVRSQYQRYPRFNRNNRARVTYKIEPLYGTDELVSIGKTVIRIAAPKRLFEHFPLAGLAVAVTYGQADEPMPLPPRMLGEVAEQLLCKAFSDFSWRQRGNAQIRDVQTWRDGLEKELHLLVHSTARDKKPASPKRTKTEKVDRMWTHYGQGGEVDSGYTGQIERLAECYSKELKRKQKWGEKLKAAGEIVPPYESFPEFLRRIANQAEQQKARWGVR